jgi:hypothetical protein
MRQSVFLAGLAPLLVLTGPVFADEPTTNPRVSTKPFEPREGAVNVPYGGFVTEITKDSITIQWTVNGVVARDVKPKRFPASETLAAGKIPKEPRPQPGSNGKYLVLPSDMYRLEDVKVGDLVSILYARVDGVDICDHICIYKRPGGRVPPLPEEAEAIRKAEWVADRLTRKGDAKQIKELEAKYIPHHEWRNAYWDLVDKGIPYPEKFGPNRRWPVAPMPRAVKITTPPISP